MRIQRLVNFNSFIKIILSISLVICNYITAVSATHDDIEKIWQEYRTQHPYGFQAVGLKHIGDECVIIISEPDKRVKPSYLEALFQKYKGVTSIKHNPFGYDGWLADFVGCIKFESDENFNKFTKELFSILYGTDYKSYYIDLDNPQQHTFFARQNLNFSVSAAEIEKWMLRDCEAFSNSSGIEKTIPQILSSDLSESNELWYSVNRGFVIWCFDAKKSNISRLFLENARKFSLDADLIMGAIGRKDGKFAIIARERNVSTEVLPPLRVEMLELLATTTINQLAQSYERYHIFAGKTKLQQDVAPIYLSDELWHTEYGNLLNLTDQMLKSWSENGFIEYYKFTHPKPVDWAFNQGAVGDLESTELTYNWNTAGAGYVIQGDDFDIYAVNRTGSLPVSYIPGGMEGKVDERVNEAEELAYDFFSELNSPELVRVVQYASIYQIFRYFNYAHPSNTLKISLSKFNLPIVPLCAYDLPESASKELLKWRDTVIVNPGNERLEPFVEKILRIAGDSSYLLKDSIIQNAMERFLEKAAINNPTVKLKELSRKDDGDKILAFLKDNLGEEYIDSMLVNPPTSEDISREFYAYLNPNLENVREYIKKYSLACDYFPYTTAAHYIVNPRQLSLDIRNIGDKEAADIREYSARVDKYNELVDKYNSEKSKAAMLSPDYFSLIFEKQSIENLERKIRKEQKEHEREIRELTLLSIDNELSKSLAALNWLLTDPDDYSEPIGEFYSGFFNDSHGQWIKSPSIACSSNATGYGGHNLDAHITPIKFEKNLRAGRCKVNFVNGQRVIAVSKSDRAKVTPAILRQVERRISESQEILLPEAPKIKSREAIFEEMNTLCIDRGFSREYEIASISPSRTVRINDVDCGTLDELFTKISDAVERGEPLPVKEIRFKNMSAREVQVQVDNLREYILERTLKNETALDDFDINAIETRIDDNGRAIISLPQKKSSIPENTFKSGTMEFKVPSGSEELFKTIIKKVYEMPDEKIDNHFKMMRQIRIELQKHPEIKMEDVKDEYIRLYGYIINYNEKNITHMVS